MNLSNLSRLKTKEFWIKEVKSINWSDVLIWIAIFLMFMASWQNIQAGKDPCNYCMVNGGPEGSVSCKEYFNQNVNLSGLIIGEGSDINGNIPINNFG